MIRAKYLSALAAALATAALVPLAGCASRPSCAFDFGDRTLVACLADGTVRESRARGIRPLLDALDGEPGAFAGARCHDRIVGRAAAFLYVKLGVGEVIAPVMSSGAIRVLESHGIVARCDEEVASIRNRANDGPCPMDAAIRSVPDSEIDRGVALLRETSARLRTATGRPRPDAPDR